MKRELPLLRVVAGAIIEGNTCFVAQRSASASHNALKWELPGGKVELDESPKAALRRELREELGIEVEIGDWLGRGRHRSSHRVIQLDVYVTRLAAGEIHLADHVDGCWARVENLTHLDWSEADRALLPALARILGG